MQILLTWNKISIASLAPQRKNFKAAKVLLEVCLMKDRHLVANLMSSFHDINLCNSENCSHIKHSNIILNKGSVTSWVSRIS